MNSDKYELKVLTNQPDVPYGVVPVILNRKTGKAIPDDEPIVIFRGKDKRLPELLRLYSKMCHNPEHCDAVDALRERVSRWQGNHQDQVKEPD